jgi:hypothetical protein
MKRGYNSNRIYRIRTFTGIMGWRGKLQVVYRTLNEWKFYARTYKLHRKLRGSMQGLWNENPVIEGSVNPLDFRRVK